MSSGSSKIVTLNVSGHLFTLPEADILKYPYSKLADVASYTLADDVASLNVPADSFAVLTYFLSTRTLPPPPLPSTVESTFKVLGIPYPSSLVIDHHTASIGASGTIREWEARLLASPGTSSSLTSSSERRDALRLIERGLLTGRPEPPSPPIDADSSGGLPGYSDISPPSSSVISKYEIIPTILRNLAPWGMSIVALIPSNVLSLAVAERPSWDTGTAASNEEEVLSFPKTAKELKKVLRLPTGGGYTWDCVLGEEFRSDMKEDLLQALESEQTMNRKNGVDYRAVQPQVLVWADEELVLKQINPMGLYETKSGKATIVQVWK